MLHGTRMQRSLAAMSSGPGVEVSRHLLTAFLILLAAQLWPTTAVAQSFYVGGRLGLVGGAVWFEDKEANDMMQPMPGLQVGGILAYQPSSILSLQTELWYVQKGWTETEAAGGRRLAYVELPVLIAVTAPWKTAPQLLAGASVGLELACSVTGVDVGSVSCDDARVEWLRAKAQLGTWLGLGLQRQVGAGKLNFQLLVNLNLTSVNRETLPRGYTRLLSAVVSAAYMIPLGGR